MIFARCSARILGAFSLTVVVAGCSDTRSDAAADNEGEDRDAPVRLDGGAGKPTGDNSGSETGGGAGSGGSSGGSSSAGGSSGASGGSSGGSAGGAGGGFDSGVNGGSVGDAGEGLSIGGNASGGDAGTEPDAGDGGSSGKGGGDAGTAGGGSSGEPSCQEDDSCPIGPVRSVAAGGDHSCALLNDGTVKCWGSDSSGQLGDGEDDQGNEASPVLVVGLSGVASIAAGNTHTCAVLQDGTAKCWGADNYGQLGNGAEEEEPTARFVPVDVIGLSAVQQIVAGERHTCALLTDGTVRCWGADTSGQLGDGDDGESSKQVPVDVTGLTGVRSIAAGVEFTCALLNSGSMKCWGQDRDGQIGDGPENPGNKHSPLDVIDLTYVESIATGGYHTCAVLVDTTVKCWGWDGAGQIGDGEQQPNQEPKYTPVVVGDLSGVQAMVGGRAHTCALLLDGPLHCWGSEDSGEVGDGGDENDIDKSSPVDIGLRDVESMAAGDDHTCVVMLGGTVKCWGLGRQGQLGTGQIVQEERSPVDVVGL